MTPESIAYYLERKPSIADHDEACPHYGMWDDDSIDILIFFVVFYIDESHEKSDY